MKGIFLIMAGLLSMTVLQVQSHAASVRAVLERNSIIAGETTGLRIEVQNGNPQPLQNFPATPGLTIQYRGISQNFTSINGQGSFSVNLNYAVTGNEPGNYTIPSVEVIVDGNPIKTQPLPFSITKANPRLQNRYAFLTLKVPRQEVYVGEVFPIDLQLYVSQAEDIQAPQLKTDGFVIHKQPPNTRSQTQIGNTIYNVLSFRMSLSAAKAGDLKLGPAEMNLTLLIRAQSDPNDPFNSIFGGGWQRRAIKLSSESLSIHVLPTPPNAPASFNGAIGKFNWSVDANPKQLNSGDPITLKINISGAGNLDSISLPALSWPDFKTYSPNNNVELKDALGLSGTKKFEQVVVPQNSGVREIPEFSWSYFDPVSKQYETLTQPAIPISVNALAGGQPAPTLASGKEVAPAPAEEPKDIIHIKASPGEFVGLSAPLVARPWFLGLEAIPIFGLLGVTIWRKRKDALANNPQLRRRIETKRFVETGLAQLRAYAAGNQDEQFYGLLFRLLQEQLGERLHMPASAITEASITEGLKTKGASEELRARLHNLFQICNQARYAPVRSHEQLLEIEAQTDSVLRDLQTLPD